MKDDDLYAALRRVGGEEPAAELDARILAAAHAAVRPAPRPRVSWVARFAPYSVAAMAILGVALSLRVVKEDAPRPPMPAERGQPRPAESAERAASEATTTSSSRSTSGALGTGGDGPPAAAGPAMRDSGHAIADRAAPMVESPAGALVGSPMAQEAKASAPAVDARKAAAREALPARVVPPPSFVADPASAGVPSHEAESRVGAAAAARRALAPEPMAPAVSSRGEESATGKDAERWIADIARQLAAGEREPARQSLREFRRIYPAYPLPPALRELEPQ